MTLLEVGRITRAHGVRGEVVVDLITHRVDRLAAGTTLQSGRGDLTIVASRPFGEKHLVTFAGVADRTGAEALRGVVLSAPPLDDEPDALWVHELVGSSVVEVNGTERGAVVAVEANPAADLLVLASGALVPVTFVVRREGDRIVVDVPDGLFEL